MKRLIGIMLCALALASAAAESETASRLDVPRYSADGQLIYPDNVDSWIVLGASIGMGYNEQDFDAKAPGSFVLVSIEPQAYAYFKKHKKFADGTLFTRRSYPAEQRLSTNRAGFVMGEHRSTEIHIVDRQKFKDGFNFAVFGAGQKQSPILPDGNGCVTCHKTNAAYQNVFAQFYPTIRHDIPKAALQASLSKGSVKLD